MRMSTDPIGLRSRCPARPERTAVPAALAMLCLAAAARAASIEAELSDHETQLNVPVTMTITLRDTQESPAAPKLPDIPGAAIQLISGPSEQSFVSIVNGQMSQSRTVSFTLRITPRRLGQLTIPAITLEADGKRFSTPPQTLMVSKGEANDLLYVEIKGDRKSIYLGEPLDLTLQIWMRPFRDRSTGYRLSGERMFRCIAFDMSNWGDFLDVLKTPNGVSVRQEMRTDSQGQQHEYYLYEVRKQMWPERSGTYDPGDITVVVNYPTRIGRSQDPFAIFNRDQMAIVNQRTISASARTDPIEIRDLPTEGRPPWFRGAVGRFDFTVSAKPTEVAVGDPITLTLTLIPRDRAKLELVQAPSLPDMPELARDFKVPSDPLAGVVQGAAKQFSQSIRAISDRVTEIPPLPFTWFDPMSGQYVTIHSAAIPLKVKPAETVSLSQVVESSPSRSAPTLLTERSSGILANYLDADQLLAREDFSPGWPTAVVALAPPLAFAAFWLTYQHRTRLRQDSAYARQRAAARRAHRAIASVGGDPRTAAPAVSLALRDYVADRCNLPPGALTADEAIGQLSRHGICAELVAQTRAVLEQCEEMQYAGAAGRDSRNGVLAQQARACIDALERERFA